MRRPGEAGARGYAYPALLVAPLALAVGVLLLGRSLTRDMSRPRRR